MFKFGLGLILFLSAPVFAADKFISENIVRLRKAVDVGTNGGDTYLYKYNVKNFDYEKPYSEIQDQIKDSGCSYQIVFTRTRVSSHINNFESFRNLDEAQAILRNLMENNKVKAAIGYYWDGSEGDSAYCSRDSVTFYFTDGQALTIDYDSTT